MKIKLKEAIILIFALMILLTGCNFGDEGGSSGGSGDSTPDTVIYSIGDTGPGGGIVFYITDEGFHGLEVSPDDLSYEMPWSKSINNTECDALSENGSENTDTIISLEEENDNYVKGTYAAGLTRTYNRGGYNDWFLPSIEQLKLLCDSAKSIDNINLSHLSYWSSTQYSSNEAYLMNFNKNKSLVYYKENGFLVRAIQAF